jgi:hypothetical protein
VSLDDFLDTCVVAWSSVNSCRAKGLNAIICSLMPVFDDVTTSQAGCPNRNETQVMSCQAFYKQKLRPGR